jgi:hypothetical protein
MISRHGDSSRSIGVGYHTRLKVTAATLVLAADLLAHEIPKDAAAHLFVRPQGNVMFVAARVPLSAMRDVVFPATPRGFLDIEKLAPKLPELAALWVGDFVEVHENGTRQKNHRVSAVQISLESDRSFVSFDEAAAHVRAPLLPASANVIAAQVWLDALIEYPIQSDRAAFSIRPGLQHLGARVVTTLRFVLPDGAVRGFEFTGDPGVVPLDPNWSQVIARFVRLGFLHILDGTDHLLFLACLVIPFRKWKPLVLVVTAFTVAHSLTLLASAFDFAPGALWFPALIETMIAISIVCMALENIVAAPEVSRRWLIALAFGLVHGFGFSFGLRETLQFAGSHLLASLMSFNAGVELGQLAALGVLIPVLNRFLGRIVPERLGTIVLSAMIAHTGWHWTTDRWSGLKQYSFEPPVMDTMFWATTTRGLAVAVAVAGLLVWFQRRLRAG